MRKAELQELEEELRRREEVLLHREACLQQKNKLEIKRLRSSQVSLFEVLLKFSKCCTRLLISDSHRLRSCVSLKMSPGNFYQ